MLVAERTPFATLPNGTGIPLRGSPRRLLDDSTQARSARARGAQGGIGERSLVRRRRVIDKCDGGRVPSSSGWSGRAARRSLGLAFAQRRLLGRGIAHADDHGLGRHGGVRAGVVQEGGSDAEGAPGRAGRPDQGSAVVLVIVDVGYGRRAAAGRASRRRSDVHHTGLDAHAGLGGCDDDGVLAVDCRGDAGAWGVRGSRVGSAIRVAGEVGVGRIAQVTGYEEMLVLGRRRGAGLGYGDGNRGNRRHEQSRRGGRCSVGDTGNVGDLDDVGGASEDGRGDRMPGADRGFSVGVAGFHVLGRLLLVPRLLLERSSSVLDAKLPDEEADHSDSDYAGYYSSSDTTDIDRGTAARRRGSARRGRGSRADILSALVAARREDKVTLLRGRARRADECLRGIALDTAVSLV